MHYVMSDIHGNKRRFESVMRQIRLQPDDTLYVLGDVIDRYPDGIRILRKLMAMPNVRMLLGNHEDMMLEALDSQNNTVDSLSPILREKKLSVWYHNGGQVTHNYLKHLRNDLRAVIFAYLRSLPLNLEIEVNETRFILTHGGDLRVFERYRMDYSDQHQYAVWHRRALSESVPGDETVIFGHTPTSHYQCDLPLRIWHGEKRIGIDCGCGFPESTKPWRRQYAGRLGCLRLEDMKEFYSEEEY